MKRKRSNSDSVFIFCSVLNFLQLRYLRVILLYKIRLMKLFSLILGLGLILTFSASAARECKSQRYKTFAEQLASLEPNGDLDLIDLDLFPGGSFVSGYEYEVEPAYTKGLYSRTDSWLVETKLKPEHGFNIADGFDGKVSAGLEQQTVASFKRFFNDPCKAMTATPYSPRRIPLKAKIALGPKFNVGDYFLFRGSVGFVASAEILSLIGSSLWGVGLSGSYLMEGFYQIHIVRIDENHVRFKVVAHRGKNISASLGLGYEKEFDVFSLNTLNNQLEKFVNTKPIKISANYGKSKVFMVDYVLNLRDEKVASAFEKVLPKLKLFKNLQMTKAFNKMDIDSNILLDLSPLEDLFREDYRNQNVGRIKRNIRTSSEQNSYGFGLHVGNKILGFKLDKGISTALMSIKADDDTVQRFLLKSWERNWDGRFLYSFLRSTKEDSLSALFSADEKFEELVPVNIVKRMQHKRNKFSYSNFQKLKKVLKKALPSEIYRTIPFETWTQKPKEKFVNYGLRFELLMAPDSILSAPELNAEQIKVLFRDHILSKGLSFADYFGTDDDRDDNGLSSEEQFEISLSQLSRLLAKALNQKIPAKERVNLITSLRANTLFSESGISFMMVLHPEKMKQNYHLDLDISSNEAIIDYSFGDSSLSNLYKKILTIKAALDDDALDLLREAESISSIPKAG
jgi:hypothetical protein